MSERVSEERVEEHRREFEEVWADHPCDVRDRFADLFRYIDQQREERARADSLLDIASGQEFYGESIEQGIERLYRWLEEEKARSLGLRVRLQRILWIAHGPLCWFWIYEDGLRTDIPGLEERACPDCREHHERVSNAGTM